MKRLLLALLISMNAAAGASAQPGPQDPSGFSGLAAGRTVAVIDDSGKETRGRLLRFTPDQLTMLVKGVPVSVDRRNVAALYERGDALTNGIIIGLVSGAAFGVIAIAGAPLAVDVETALVRITLIGLGAGAGVDAMIVRKRLIYDRAAGPDDRDSVAISIAPTISRARMSLSTSVVW